MEKFYICGHSLSLEKIFVGKVLNFRSEFGGAFSVRSILCMGNLKSVFWGQFFYLRAFLCYKYIYIGAFFKLRVYCKTSKFLQNFKKF